MREDILLRFHSGIRNPAILYGSERWTLSKAEQRRIEIFLRPLAGATAINNVRNEDIGQQLGEDTVIHGTGECRQRWDDHVHWVLADRLPGGQRRPRKPCHVPCFGPDSILLRHQEEKEKQLFEDALSL
jgi:hypothetical protein